MFDAYLMAIFTTLSLSLAPAMNDAASSPPLVGPGWLVQRLDDPQLVVLDIREPFGAVGRHSDEAGHIPGAIHSSYVGDGWRDTRISVPTALPPLAPLEALLGRLGVSNSSRVVIAHSGKDSADFSSAARVYWIFRLLGHDRVSILNGGYRAWLAAALPVETAWQDRRPAVFRAHVRPALVATTAYVTQAIEHGAQLVDSRVHNASADADADADAGQGQYESRTVALPIAKSLEHLLMIDPESGRFIDRQALSTLLDEHGVKPARVTVVFCETGHDSATTWFALHAVMGYRNVRLYDGAVADWAASTTTPLMKIDNSEG